jgi:hypothetical protein
MFSSLAESRTPKAESLKKPAQLAPKMRLDIITVTVQIDSSAEG